MNRGEELKVLGAAVARAHMEDDRFHLAFTNGVTLEIVEHFTPDDDWMEVTVR